MADDTFLLQKIADIEQKVNSITTDIAVIKTRLIGNGSGGVLDDMEDIRKDVDGLKNFKSYLMGMASVSALLALVAMFKSMGIF